MFAVHVSCSRTGDERTFLLEQGLKPNDLQSLFKSSFCDSLSSGDMVVGFREHDSSFFWPFSVLCYNPKIMHGKRLLLLTTSSSMQALPKEEGKEESEYDNEAKDEGENEEESSESESDESSDSYAAISEFLNDSVAPYTGGPMSIDDARATLGLDRYQADAVIGYLSSYSNDSGLITKIQVHLAILSLLGESYVSFPMQERAKSNFILDRLFSSFDPTNTGRCYLRDIGCALLLFCGGSGASRAHAAFALLVLLESRFDSRSSSSPATVDFLHLLVVVKSVASLFKAAKCLDPAVIPEDCAYGDHLAAKQALQYFMAQDRDKDSDAIIEEYQTVYLEDFTNLFTAMIALLESDSLGIDLSLLPSPPAKKLNHFLKDELDLNWPDSMDSEDDDQEVRYCSINQSITSINHINLHTLFFTRLALQCNSIT